jgi:hypothetical protein
MNFNWQTLGNAIPIVNIILKITKKNEDSNVNVFSVSEILSTILVCIFAIIINISRNKDNRFNFSTFIAAIFAPYYLAYILLKVKLFDKQNLTFII